LDGTAGSCSIHNRERKGEKRPLGKLRLKIEDNFKMDRKKKKWKGSDWINMGQVRAEGRAFGKTVTVRLIP
jgi:hypothetical protein